MEANLEHIDRVFKKDVCGWDSSPDLLDCIYLHKPCEIIPVSFIMAAHWFVSRHCILKVGGFSPTFPHYGEDRNYIQRALFWGFKIGVVPSLQVVHDRENRPTPKKKQIYLKYIFNLVKLSNPSINTKKALFNVTYSSIRSVFSFHSLVPLWNLLKIYFGFSKIVSDKRISIKNDNAFIR